MTLSDRQERDLAELAAETELARLIKRAVAAGGRGWCATTPRAIAMFLIAYGVTLPDTEPEEATR